MDCVHHSNYIRWFEEARIHLMEELRFSAGYHVCRVGSPDQRIWRRPSPPLSRSCWGLRRGLDPDR